MGSLSEKQIDKIGNRFANDKQKVVLFKSMYKNCFKLLLTNTFPYIRIVYVKHGIAHIMPIDRLIPFKFNWTKFITKFQGYCVCTEE